MDDRELLELAAKAAGVQIEFHEQRTPVRVYSKDDQPKLGEYMPIFWNPLREDGDALRLAVKLGIEIHPMPFGGRAIVRDEDDCGEQFDEESSDQLSATRRAIVRAAAEIGRQA
jgi:hypothetical protein